MKIHKQIYRQDFPFKGVTTNTTLCGRENKGSWDISNGSNVSGKDEEVTCFFCKRILKLQNKKEVK